MPFVINNQTRPYDFGTDAIERQRVSLGQSVIDADFEYGLQATKWQTYQEVRKNPSFYEIPGTDLVITDVQTNAATPSTITLYTTVNATSNLLVAGSVINITGLQNATRKQDRAEGFFLVTSNTTSTVTYTAKGQVGTSTDSTAGSIFTSYTVARRGGIFNNGNAKIQVSSISQSGTTVTVTTTTVHGLIPGTPITANTWASATGTLYVGGDYFLEAVPTSTTFAFTSSTSSTGTGVSTGGNMYVQPYSYVIHRPFDGGVLLSVGQPAYGSSVMRQSKKVFRYQSGKGFLWSSGTLFCPNNDIVSLTASSATLPSVITAVCAVNHGAPQQGATVIIRGCATASYNGTYTVASVVDSRTITVNALVNPGVTTAVLGQQPRFIISNWSGATVRAGPHEDQNGFFWEFDGQTLFVVKRSSTQQIAGLCYTNALSQTLTGDANARFQDQLRVGQRITLRGMTHTITGIQSQTQLTFNPPYRGAANIPSSQPVQACLIIDTKIPQSQFNKDTIDGNGPSGYAVDLTRMQMIGMQYTWYGAGFADFMIRQTNGNWVMVHRFVNNNVNDEAYMRTGNMPVRYELANEATSAISTLAVAMGTGDTSLTLTDQTTYWPSSGVVYIDSELISYTGKSGATLTGLTRNANLSYNIADISRTYTGSTAATHSIGTSVNLVSVTCAPSLTHWGSAFIMDGQFDNDRGYFFNYQFNQSTTLTASVGTVLWFMRLSPSVSNGIIGDIGTRDLLNRAQLLLQHLDVACFGTGAVLNIIGVLNPQGITIPYANWSAVNSVAQGGQPSFSQYATSYNGSYVVGSGERIFSMIASVGNQVTLDLSGLKELSNAVVGGNGFFPDGPDTLMIYVTALNANITSATFNMYWSEAQA